MKSQYKLTLVIIIPLLISCQIGKKNLDELPDLDYKYKTTQNLIFKHDNFSSYVKPLIIDDSGSVMTYYLQYNSIYAHQKSELIAYKGLIDYASSEFTRHRTFQDAYITDFKALDIIGDDGVKEILIIYSNNSKCYLEILNSFNLNTISNYYLCPAYDIDGFGGVDAALRILGVLESDGDGNLDILLSYDIGRDSFPISLFSYSIAKEKILWSNYFASHLHGQIDIIDLDDNGRNEVLGCAQTTHNNTMLKREENRYLYKHGDFRGAFGLKGDRLDDEDLDYSFTEADSNVEWGARSYMFLIDDNGDFIWKRNFGNDGDVIRYAYKDRDDEFKIYINTAPYSSENMDSSKIFIVDGFTGTGTQYSDLYMSNIYNFKMVNGSDQTRIVTFSHGGMVSWLDERLNLIYQKADPSFAYIIFAEDINDDNIEEYGFFTKSGNILVTDSLLNPLMRFNGYYKEFFFNLIEKEENSIIVPVSFAESYEIMAVSDQSKSVLYVAWKYRFYILGILILLNSVFAGYVIRAWRKKRSIKDLIIFGDMLTEFETGLLIIHRTKNRYFVNRYFGTLFDMPFNIILQSDGIKNERKEFERVINHVREKSKNRNVLNSWESEEKIGDKDYNFVWGILGHKTGSLRPGYYTVFGFNRTDFVRGRWAIAWGHIAQKKMHSVKNDIRRAISKTTQFARHGDSRKEIAEEIEKQLSPAEQNIISILKGSQLDDPEKEAINLLDLIRGLHVYGKNSMEGTGIKISYSCYIDKALVLGFKPRLFEAFQNILINSLKAIDEKTQSESGNIWITISSARKLRDIKIVDVSIKDDGLGIEADEIPKLFDRNYSKFKSGSGFGLTFAKYVIANHGGEINVESESGKHTTFRVTLPLYEERI